MENGSQKYATLQIAHKPLGVGSRQVLSDSRKDLPWAALGRFRSVCCGNDSKAMNEEQQFFIEQMIRNLPTLRMKLRGSQEEIAFLAGTSRCKINAVELRKSEMTWSLFLALFFVFEANGKTAVLLPPMDMDPVAVCKLIQADYIKEHPIPMEEKTSLKKDKKKSGEPADFDNLPYW